MTNNQIIIHNMLQRIAKDMKERGKPVSETWRKGFTPDFIPTAYYVTENIGDGIANGIQNAWGLAADKQIATAIAINTLTHIKMENFK